MKENTLPVADQAASKHEGRKVNSYKKTIYLLVLIIVFQAGEFIQKLTAGHHID